MDGIYSLPNPSLRYKCSPITKSEKFTILMKWVMLTRKHPELLQKIEEICQTDPNIINEKNSAGWTALMMAARNSNTDSTEETVKLLLQHGADPNLQNNNGLNALMMAVLHSRNQSTEETVKLLLAGSDINLQEIDGWTALMLSCQSSRINSTENTVALLLQHGADPNLRNKNHSTALMVAATPASNQSTYETVKILLENGAKCNLQNIYGCTALMQTARFIKFSTEHTIRLLLENGANPNLRDVCNETALSLAIKKINIATTEIDIGIIEGAINILLQYGAVADYNSLETLLVAGQPELLEKMINAVYNISKTQFMRIFGSVSDNIRAKLQKIIPRINFDTKSITIEDKIYGEKSRKLALQNMYSRALIDIPMTRNQIIYKDTSFGGWITVKKLEMSANNQTIQSLFDTLLVSNNIDDRKYMDLFCIHDISRLEELFAYY